MMKKSVNGKDMVGFCQIPTKTLKKKQRWVYHNLKNQPCVVFAKKTIIIIIGVMINQIYSQ